MDSFHIVIILLILLLYLYSYNNYKYLASTYTPYKKVLYSQVKDSLKTGDLIFFKTYLYGGRPFLINFFGKFDYVHAGIVWKDKSGLYVIERLNRGNDNSDFIRMGIGKLTKNTYKVPLELRISKSQGQFYVLPLRNELKDEQKKILEHYFMKESVDKFPSKLDEVKAFFGSDVQNENCFIYIMKALKLAKIFPRDKYIYSIYFNIRGDERPDWFPYDHVNEIIYDGKIESIST